MQWYKSAMMVSLMVGVAALSANGCSTKNPGNGDGGDAAGNGDGPLGKDSNTKDVAQQGDSGSCGAVSCEVCDVSSYSPTAQGKPIGPKNAMCPAADITAFTTACGSAGTTTTCQTWQTNEKTSNANCLNCVFTLKTAATWGPLVCTQTGCSLNQPGCVDMALGQVSQENSTSTGSCGDYLSASYGCQDAACSTCTTTDFSNCVQDAIANECKTYADAFQNATICSALNGDAPPAATSNCFPSGSGGFTDTELGNFIDYFCGQ
jgi:hypothetical protein